jgi:hypothetical protein
MREVEENTRAEGGLDDDHEEELLAFAAFALVHAACCDVMEVRVSERCILEWCPSCATVRAFVSPGG